MPKISLTGLVGCAKIKGYSMEVTVDKCKFGRIIVKLGVLRGSDYHSRFFGSAPMIHPEFFRKGHKVIYNGN